MDFLKLYHSDDQGSCCCNCGDSCEDESFDDAEIVLVDPETNEEFSFIFYDNFTFEGEEYCVLATQEDEEDDESISLLIMQYLCDESGEESLVSLDEDDEDRIYDAYEALLDELDEEEENEEE